MIIEAKRFIKNIQQEIENLNLDLSKAFPDHLCYRVATMDEYRLFQVKLSQIGQLIIEANVNGRPISTYRLHESLTYNQHEIDIIELPAPKQGTQHETGYEHIEFVIAESFQTFINRHRLSKQKIGGNVNLNPEMKLDLGFKFGQVKLHYQPLDRVIEIEESCITDIFFDLDGTLINSRETIYLINQKVFSSILNRDISLQEIKSKFATEFKKLFQLFGVENYETQQLAMNLWGKIALSHSYDLFADAKEALIKLRNYGFNLHIWTARDTESTLMILDNYEIRNIFTSINCNDGITSKPNPDNIRVNLDSLNKNSYLMVGDSKTDMIAAKNIKAISVAALWDPHIDIDEVIAHGMDMSFQSLTELANWLILRKNEV